MNHHPRALTSGTVVAALAFPIALSLSGVSFGQVTDALDVSNPTLFGQPRVELVGDRSIISFDISPGTNLTVADPLTVALEFFTINIGNTVTVQSSVIVPAAALDLNGDGVFGEAGDTIFAGPTTGSKIDLGAIPSFKTLFSDVNNMTSQIVVASAGMRISIDDAAVGANTARTLIVSTSASTTTFGGRFIEWVDESVAADFSALSIQSALLDPANNTLLLTFSRSLRSEPDAAGATANDLNQTAVGAAALLTGADFQIAATADAASNPPLLGVNAGDVSVVGALLDSLLIQLPAATNVALYDFIRIAPTNTTIKDILGNSPNSTAIPVVSNNIQPTPLTILAPRLGDRELVGAKSVVTILVPAGLNGTGEVVTSENITILVDTINNAGQQVFPQVTFNTTIAYMNIPALVTVDLGHVAGLKFVLTNPAVTGVRFSATSATGTGLAAVLNLADEALDQIAAPDTASPALVRAFLNDTTPPSKLFLVFDQPLNAGAASNDMNQTVLTSITGGNLQFNAFATFTGIEPSPVGLSNPAFVGASDSAISFDLAGVNDATLGDFLRPNFNNAAPPVVMNDFRDIAGNTAAPNAVTISRAGDINADGVVNAFDLAELIGSWGTASSLTDLNGDGVINAVDLATLLGQWG